MIEEELKEIFNLEIIRELMKEINPDVSDNDVEYIYKKCDGNPWNAGILYSLMLKSGKMVK